MEQVFAKKGVVSTNKVPAPQVTGKSVLVLNQYSLISAGTEASAVKSTGNSLLQMAKKNPENVTKVLKMIREKGIKNAYQQVSSVLKGFYEFGSEIGYSCAGIVIDVGEEINDIKIGDRVACAGAGVANHAEIVCVPRNLVVKVPKDLDLEQACSVTVGAIALQGVRQADPKLGEKVAVIGLGLLGQITVQLLKSNGCSVIGSDLEKDKLDLARELGADEVINGRQENLVDRVNIFSEGKGVDAVIITAASTSSEILNQSMKICRRKGKIVIVGAIGMDLQREDFYKKEIDLKISCSYGPGRYDDEYEKKGKDYPYDYVRWTENRNMQSYLRLIASQEINFKKIITHRFNLNEVSQAYQLIKDSNEPTLAIILNYPKYEENKLKKIEKTIINQNKKATKKEKINVAVIGCGGFATSTHLPNLLKLNKYYNLRATVDRSGATTQKSSIQYNADYSTTDHRRVMNDKNVDMIMITTRHNNHADLVIEGLENNKIVFVEKPLAVNQKQLEKVASAYKSADKPILVGFNRRFSPLAQKVSDLTKNRKNPIILNYRMNAGYIPLDHWVHASEGGGRIIGEACHIYDLFDFYVNSQVEEVSAHSINPKTENYSHTDNVISTIKYKDGSVCNLVYTAMGASEMTKEYFDLFCEGKVYSLSDYKELKVFGGPGSKKLIEQDKGHLNELKIFAAGIKAGKSPITFASLLQTTEISLKVNDLIKIK